MSIVAAAINWSHRPWALFFLRRALRSDKRYSIRPTLELRRLIANEQGLSLSSMSLRESRCEDACS